MPYYVVKVTDKDGWLMPPIVAHASTEGAAIEQVTTIFPDDCKIEAKGIRPDTMIASFGNMPRGAVSIRPDWAWKGEADDVPAPY